MKIKKFVQILWENIFFRYLISGGIGAITLLFFLAFFYEIINLHYLVSSTIGFCLAIMVSFLMQKYLTFQERNFLNGKEQFLKHAVLAVVNLAINYALMLFFVEKIHIWYLMAQIITAATIALWSFFIYRNYIFKPQY